jgi:hypothetical protein
MLSCYFASKSTFGCACETRIKEELDTPLARYLRQTNQRDEVTKGPTQTQDTAEGTANSDSPPSTPERPFSTTHKPGRISTAGVPKYEGTLFDMTSYEVRICFRWLLRLAPAP